MRVRSLGAALVALLATVGTTMACSRSPLVFAPTESTLASGEGGDGGTALQAKVGPAAPPDGRARVFAGVWRDTESNADFTIATRDDGVPVVEAAVDEDDGEVYVVLASNFLATGAVLRLSWAIRVGSTGVTVRYDCAEPSGDDLECQWWASAAEGHETLRRVARDADPGRR
ncbi:MAG: hypothetical protein U0169_17310 [Polyangiaceae bacterium]